ncbi:MAG: 50S ribosomal protein L29 [Bacteroidales bacterium]|nr:50S ribosomal protein L29 [Bacteroidales bacterium]
MKSSEIKELTTKELIEKIETEKSFLIRQNLNHAVSPLENPLKIRETRKNIARLLTELNIREKIETNKES